MSPNYIMFFLLRHIRNQHKHRNNYIHQKQMNRKKRKKPQFPNSNNSAPPQLPLSPHSWRRSPWHSPWHCRQPWTPWVWRSPGRLWPNSISEGLLKSEMEDCHLLFFWGPLIFIDVSTLVVIVRIFRWWLILCQIWLGIAKSLFKYETWKDSRIGINDQIKTGLIPSPWWPLSCSITDSRQLKLSKCDSPNGIFFCVMLRDHSQRPSIMRTQSP